MKPPRRAVSLLAVWAIPFFAVTTVGLGLAGWLEHGLRFDDALYRAIGLFSLDHEAYQVPPGSTDWHFLVGRWTGLIALFGAGLAALGALLDEHAVLAVAHLLRQQVMLIGASDVAQKAFGVARDHGKSAVWVGASAIDSSSLRAFALPWPPDDHVRTISRYVADADHVLIAQDNDADALVLAQAARVASPRAFITVLMRDAWLAEDAAAMINQPRTRVLSGPAVSARALTIEHPPFLIAQEHGHARIHALIVGFGQVGQAIARELIVNCRTTYLGVPQITVIDPAAKALEGVMRVRAPELDLCAHFTFIEGAVGTQGVAPRAAELGPAVAAGGPVTAAYVCRDLDAEGLSAAGMVQSLLRTADLGEPPIFVRLREKETLTRVTDHGRGLNALIPFGDLDDVVAAIEFLSNTPDQAARAFSAAYRATLPPEKRDDPNNRSALPWDELDETFRQATRDAVAHIPAKMASAGIDPVWWRGKSGPPHLPRDVPLFTDAADIEPLARLEHDRWNAQRRMDGWRWADIPKKDEHRRIHPDLVDYERLADNVKEYDRAIVRETQLICWNAPAN
jgi:hypothetical protein